MWRHGTVLGTKRVKWSKDVLHGMRHYTESLLSVIGTITVIHFKTHIFLPVLASKY